MNLRSILVVAAIVVASSPLSAGVRSDVRESFEFGSTPAELVVDTSGADVRVIAVDSGRMDVTIERESRSNDAETAAAEFDRLLTTIERDGNTIRVTARHRSSVSWRNHPRVDVVARVPRATLLNVRTSGGDIDVRGTHRPFTLSTSGGDITLADTNGGSEARTSGGDIEAHGHRGPLALHTSGGDIEVEGVDGDLRARTSGGDVEVRTLGGFVYAQTSGGDVSIAGAVTGGSAGTSGGDVRIALTRSPASDFEISTTGSDIDILVGSGVGFDLDARAGRDRVRVDVPMSAASVERRRTRGAVQGGGATLSVRTSGGEVRVRPLK